MCGIIGWVDWQRDLSAQNQIIRRMTQTLIARGPDAEGYWLSPEAAFGHRRLIVIDPEGGIQPMTREQAGKAYTLVYNGELYNTGELRSALMSRGYHFQGHSDTEVLLLSYIEWGPASVEHLNGIFAFAVWDAANDHLFLARDRMGVKPLFFAEKSGFLLFASELKALLAHPDIQPVVDQTGLAEVFLVGPARTPGQGVYKGIAELKPGHALIYSRNGCRNYPYWALPAGEHDDDFETTVATVRELFLDTVKRQMVSDVPIGTLLSGGLDSSAITAIAAGHQAVLGENLATFSVDYVDNEKYFQPNAFQPNADAPWIAKVSEHFQTKHHSFQFDTPELAEALITAVQARDLPGMADIDSSLYLFARQIKQNVTVGLSGECADEVFGGYPWFYREEALQAQTFPWALRLDHRLQILSPELIEKLQPQEYLATRYEEALAEVPPQPGKRKNVKDNMENWREARLREISYLTLTRFMPTLLDRKDRMTMAVGLEVRVPFCDHRLVEYVWKIPWQFKAWQGREKGLLRQALTGILPEDVLWRRKSPYPKTHNPSYLSTVRARLAEILEEPNSPLLPLLNLPALQELMKISDSLPSGRPWFGQLMDTPQMFAFLIQVDYWLRANHVQII